MQISEKRLLKYSLYGIAIYIFLFFLLEVENGGILKLLITIPYVLSVISLLSICYKNRHQLSGIPKTARNIFYVLIFWGFITAARGFSLSPQDWITNFGNVYMAWAWFTPLMIIVGQKIENWKTIITCIFFMFQLMVISMFFLPFFFNIRPEWTWMLRPLNFIMLLGISRYNASSRLLVYVLVVCYIIVAIKVEQRIEFVYLFMVFLFLTIDTLKHLKIKYKLLKISLFGFLALLIFVFAYGYENISIMVSNYIEFQDSRTFLFKELMSELNGVEKIFGRGSLGTYFSEYFEHTKWYTEEILKQTWYGDSSTRITTEVGYLQMILKGGFLMLFLNTFLMTYAIYKALFRSNNRFIKRLGLYILILLILSLISFRPAFTPTFIILWTAIGTVLNKKYRTMQDEEIEQLIKFK
ncbi:MAG: hypothetical protein R2797_02335 [Gelidibacter sp.]